MYQILAVLLVPMMVFGAVSIYVPAPMALCIRAWRQQETPPLKKLKLTRMETIAARLVGAGFCGSGIWLLYRVSVKFDTLDRYGLVLAAALCIVAAIIVLAQPDFVDSCLHQKVYTKRAPWGREQKEDLILIPLMLVAGIIFLLVIIFSE